MRLIIITACRNAREHLQPLCDSIDSQSDDRWEHIIVDDCSGEGRGIDPLELADRSMGGRRELLINKERKWALHNIVEVARRYQDDPEAIIATVDGDDELCNDEAVKLVLSAYEEEPEVDVVWTGQKWDIRDDINVSRPMPDKVDPYEWSWCTSHLRTFRASLLKGISDDNFRDYKGEWFKRGYDQILMLPVLKVGRKRRYIDEVCYMYRMDSVSIPLNQRAGTEVEQIHNICFVRARGFLG